MLFVVFYGYFLDVKPVRHLKIMAVLKSVVSVGSQAVLKLLFSVVSLKIVAYYAGPSGMAIIGQLQSFLQIASAGASSVTSAGVVKLIAEGKCHKDNVASVSFVLLICYSAVMLFFFLGLSVFISEYFFGGKWVFAISLLPIAAFFLGVGNLVVSCYNGCQDYKKHFSYSVISAFFVAIITSAISFFYGSEGAVYSVVAAPVLAGVVMIVAFGGVGFSRFDFCFKRDLILAKSLVHFSSMAIGSAVVVYGGQIYLRDFISENVSVDSAGIWYSATRISDIYMGVASVLFSTILLPRYSSRSDESLSEEVGKMFFLSVFFAVALIIFINYTSFFLVSVIYGEVFVGASNIIGLYVLGDALKVVSWVFLYVLIARKKVLFYLFYEVFSASCYVVFSVIACDRYGFSYTPLGYVVQSLVSLCLVGFWFLFFRGRVAIYSTGD